MKILDCESFESTLFSISNICGISNSNVTEYLSSINDNKLYKKYKNNFGWFSDILVYDFAKKFSVEIEYDNLCWFHLARVNDSKDILTKGILPLNEALESIWNQIITLINGRIAIDDILQMKHSSNISGHNEWLYKFKTADKEHFGPFAMLVREAAFNNKEIGNYNYLEMPEIVREIIIGIKKKYDLDLYDDYINSTESVIVKFNTPVSLAKCSHYLGIALCYLYHRIKNEKFSSDSNMTYNGKGIGVLPKDIVSIEKLKLSKADFEGNSFFSVYSS